VSDPRLMWDQIREKRLIALLSPASADDCLSAYETLDPLGIVLEVALRTEAALHGIALIRKHHPKALLLAGTVLTSHQAQQAIAAGVSGIVCPDYISAVVETTVKSDRICVPGGLGDAGKQLVQKAELYDCDLETLRQLHPYQWNYKLFPALANDDRLATAKAWRSVYRELTIIYTGGISLANVDRIVQADPGGVICASALCTNPRDPAAMDSTARQWLSRLDVDQDPQDAKPVATTPAISIEPAEQGDAKHSTGSITAVTCGEVMLRLSPPHGERLVQANSLQASYGGAEANVAVSLAQFGHNVRFTGAVPENSLGQAALNRLSAFGVDTSYVQRRGQRLGIYFLEHGASQRPSRVIYDRAFSAQSDLGSGCFDWDQVFDGANWFHWSGITPALGEKNQALIREAVAAAKRNDVIVSVDLNYRSRLWDRKTAGKVMAPLVEQADLVIGNESDVADVFRIAAGNSDPEAGQIDLAGYREIATTMIQRFGLGQIAITLRESISASRNIWSAVLAGGDQFCHSRRYDITVVDRVGSGDAFAAGLIHGLATGMSNPVALEFAVAASCLKHSVEGDFNIVSIAEVEALVAGDGTGRVKR
jgi:2-dehydro-3-deoxygluconokinase